MKMITECLHLVNTFWIVGMYKRIDTIYEIIPVRQHVLETTPCEQWPNEYLHLCVCEM